MIHGLFCKTSKHVRLTSRRVLGFSRRFWAHHRPFESPSVECAPLCIISAPWVGATFIPLILSVLAQIWVCRIYFDQLWHFLKIYDYVDIFILEIAKYCLSKCFDRQMAIEWRFILDPMRLYGAPDNLSGTGPCM